MQRELHRAAALTRWVAAWSHLESVPRTSPGSSEKKAGQASSFGGSRAWLARTDRRAGAVEAAALAAPDAPKPLSSASGHRLSSALCLGLAGLASFSARARAECNEPRRAGWLLAPPAPCPVPHSSSSGHISSSRAAAPPAAPSALPATPARRLAFPAVTPSSSSGQYSSASYACCPEPPSSRSLASMRGGTARI